MWTTLPSAAPDLPLLEAAARDAGEIARAAFGRKVEIWSKGAAGPVTEVDLAIDRMLHDVLLRERPDYGWLSEETADTDERLSKRRVFVIDPIDGTQAFIAGRPQFTISIGLVEDGRAIAGAVYNPIKDEMFLGALGVGATLNDEPIRASSTNKLEGASLIGKRGFFADDKWPKPWPEMQLSFRPSIARRLALVASGRFDGVILAGFKHEWDIAAGVVLVEAAGGRVTDPWGEPLSFNAARPRAPGLVAAGAQLHPLLIERLVTLPDPREERS
ncbi:MAG: 3'(2'),5'-bisphosphate nucleotidase CysQ [Pseudomonadota bacterium]